MMPFLRIGFLFYIFYHNLNVILIFYIIVIYYFMILLLFQIIYYIMTHCDMTDDDTLWYVTFFIL